MKVITKIFLAGTGMLSVATAGAQVQQKDSTLNRTVVVENQYNPEVMDAFKVNVLPKVEEPVVAKKNIDYATSARPLSSFGFEPMGVISRNVHQKGARRGYLRGAYGMLNRTDVKAAYLWDISKRDQLDVMGSFYGYSGDVDAIMDDRETNQRFYRTDVGLDYSHLFNKVKLNLGGSFGSQVFAYQLGSLPSTDGDESKSAEAHSGRNQHFVIGDGHFGLTSVEGQTPVDFSLTVGFNGFKRKYWVGNMVDMSQKLIYVRGGASGTLEDHQRVGVDFGVNHLMYSHENYQVDNSADTKVEGLYGLDDNTLVQLNPYYAIQMENLDVRLGAHVDIQTKVGSGLKVAPDLKVAYTFSDSFVLYAQALGGTQMNDFNQLNQVSPFWTMRNQLKPTYTIFDAQAGLKASPTNGLGLKVYGGYRLTKDDLFLLCEEYSNGAQLMMAGVNQEKSKVFYAGAGLDCDYRDVFSFGIKGQYNNWKVGNKENIYFLQLKPEFVFDINVRAKVANDLHAFANYRYENRKKISNNRLDALNSLKLGAEYNYNERFNVFVHVDNLLNQTYLTEAAYPVLGLNVLGGVSYNF